MGVLKDSIETISNRDPKDSLDLINSGDSGDNRDSRDSPTIIKSHLNVGYANRKAICEGIAWFTSTQ